MSQTTARPLQSGQPATPGKDPAPLGKHPSSEKALDVAVQYTFPASDPTAVGAAIHAAEEEAPPADPGTSNVSRQGDFPWPKGAHARRG